MVLLELRLLQMMNHSTAVRTKKRTIEAITTDMNILVRIFAHPAKQRRGVAEPNYAL